MNTSFSYLHSLLIKYTALLTRIHCSHWELYSTTITQWHKTISVHVERCSKGVYLLSMKPQLITLKITHQLLCNWDPSVRSDKSLFSVLFGSNIFLCTFELSFPYLVLALLAFCLLGFSKVFLSSRIPLVVFQGDY